MFSVWHSSTGEELHSFFPRMQPAFFVIFQVIVIEILMKTVNPFSG
uniref:Uncharacterized protein n=1 Tax=Rhizophora mucronata TaxID=61149 RepID=A0A2P2QVF3_RHIMU